MNILFFTIVKITSLEERGIYTDLLRKFRDDGHSVFIVTPTERRYRISTNLKKEKGANILQIKTLNLQKSNAIEKGIGILALEYQFLWAIKKQFLNVKFNLILYSTPPITFTKSINYIKKRDKAFSYLLLKDIFPQNAVDMNMIKKGSILHRLFLIKERKLYEVSDMIGCMSEANRNYLIAHNDFLRPEKIEVNPNSIEPLEQKRSIGNKEAIREKYALPVDAKTKIFVYGGNLGLPQGINFLLQTIESCRLQNVFFLIVGSGREYDRIAKWFEKKNLANAKLMEGLPKVEYDELVNACDVGMIFLNPNFTIPNFPSRLLSYLECSMPVLAATDKTTDLGLVIERAGCGLWVQSGDLRGMLLAIHKLMESEAELLLMKENSRILLENEYKVDISYHLIESKLRSNV